MQAYHIIMRIFLKKHTMKPTIFILASDFRQYTNYLNTRKDLKRFAFRYLASNSDVYGLHGVDLIVLSSAKNRQDYNTIMSYASTAGFEIETINYKEEELC